MAGVPSRAFSGVSGGFTNFPSLGGGTAATNTPKAKATEKQTDQIVAAFQGPSSRPPLWGDTQTPGLSDSARKIGAASQKANLMTGLGRTIGKFIEDGIKGLGKLFESATASKKDEKPKGKETQLAQNNPQDTPAPVEVEPESESETSE